MAEFVKKNARERPFPVILTSFSRSLWPKTMTPLDLVKLSPLMELTPGRPVIMVGLINGPVAINHADLAGGTSACSREQRRAYATPCSASRRTRFIFGQIVGIEFRMERDPASIPCDDSKSLAKWKSSRGFQSKWI
jgi:hypothetical protein